MILTRIFSWLGLPAAGACSRFYTEADEVVIAARQLKADLEPYHSTPDPLAAVLGTIWNNRQWQKFVDHPVDTGNGTGVGTQPIKGPHAATR
jgi:hypothetical protein